MARELAKNIGVLEPLQTAGSVAGQVAELKETIEQNASAPVVLIGWSWGAWLSFMTASENPSLVRKLIFISSGPFEQKYAGQIMDSRLSRLNEKERIEANHILGRLEAGEKVGEEEFARFGGLMSKTDSFDPMPSEKGDALPTEPDIYEKVWKEAEDLRKSGKLLEYGEHINCPVVVIHGDYDPHPFAGVHDPLSKVLKDVKFVLLPNCGHTPWLENQAKEEFYKVLNEEI